MDDNDTPVEPLGPDDLELRRDLGAPRAAVWRCWTEPDLLMQWFCPAPWRVTECTIDLRPGGGFVTVMEGPEGERHPGTGVYLEVVPQTRLVFTDALQPGWRPAETAFITALVVLGDTPGSAGTGRAGLTGGATTLLWRALHRNPADREKHLQMGFEAGWGTAAQQLEDLARTIA